MNIKNYISKNYLKIVFIIGGAVAGFLYWKFIGCESGTCRIKSVWYWSTLYGAIFGYLIGDLITGFISKLSKRKNPEPEGQDS